MTEQAMEEEDRFAAMMEDMSQHAAERARAAISETASLMKSPAESAGVIVSAATLVFHAALNMIESQENPVGRKALATLLIDVMAGDPDTGEALERVRALAREGDE